MGAAVMMVACLKLPRRQSAADHALDRPALERQAMRIKEETPVHHAATFTIPKPGEAVKESMRRAGCVPR